MRSNDIALYTPKVKEQILYVGWAAIKAGWYISDLEFVYISDDHISDFWAWCYCLDAPL